MNWYYVDAGKQAGPVDDIQLQQLVQSGVIQAETMVWHEGMPNWQSYREATQPGGAPPGVATAASPASDEAVCVECHQVFNKQDMIQYGTVHVCSGCKPVFMQKLAEGVHVTGRSGQRTLPVNADALIQEIDSRDYQIDVGSCISRGWAAVKANMGICVGATFLVMLCTQAAGVVPILGVIASLILQGPLIGGLYYFYVKLVRGQEVTLGDAFSGFSIGFWRLCGTLLLMSLLLYLPVIPGAIALFATMSRGSGPSALAWVLLIPGIIGMVYLGVAFSFGMPLAADMRLGPWDALRVSFRTVSKHWFAIFGLLFVSALLGFVGVLACLFGILVTLPIFYAATMFAYEDIFGMR